MSATATKLLDAAQTLVQERGYNAFSYADLAKLVGIRTSSIHYHFESKAVLGQAVMVRYSDNLDEAFVEIDAQHPSATERLHAFIGLYRATQERGVICLCGSLASDATTLPPPLQEGVASYLARSEQWVASKVREGLEQGEFSRGDPESQAASLVAGLQGGLILARVATSAEQVLSHVENAFFSALR